MKHFIAKEGNTLIEIVGLLRKHKVSYSIGKIIDDDSDVYISLIPEKALDELRDIFVRNYEGDAYGLPDNLRDGCRFATLRNKLHETNIENYCGMHVVTGDELGDYIFSKHSSVQGVFANVDGEGYSTIDMIYTIEEGVQKIASKRLSNCDGPLTILAAYNNFVADNLETPVELISAPIKDLVQLAKEVQFVNNKYYVHELGPNFNVVLNSKPYYDTYNVLFDIGDVVIQTNNDAAGVVLAKLFAEDLNIDNIDMVYYSPSDNYCDYYQIFKYSCDGDRINAEGIIDEFYNKQHKGPYYEVNGVMQPNVKFNATLAYKKEISYNDGEVKSIEAISNDKNIAAIVTPLYQEGKEHLSVPVTDTMELPCDCSIAVNKKNGVCIVKSGRDSSVLSLEELYKFQEHITNAIKLQEGYMQATLDLPSQDAEIISSEILRYPGLANTPAACLINIAVMDSKTIVVASQLSVTEDGKRYQNTSVTNGLEEIRAVVEQQYNISGNVHWFEHYPVGVGINKSMDILKEVKFKENGSPMWGELYDLCIDSSAKGFHDNFGLTSEDILKNYPR